MYVSNTATACSCLIAFINECQAQLGKNGLLRLSPSVGVNPRILANSASIDHGPGPTNSKKAQFSSCAYSERISCSTAQKPICGGTGGSGSGEVPRYKGIFVDAIATTISMMKGSRGEMRRRKSQLRKTSDALICIDEFKNALPQEYSPGHQSDQDYRSWTICRWV
jgi:hypothetical protein